MKRLPALVILWALGVPAAAVGDAARYDPYTPPGAPPAAAQPLYGVHAAVARIIVPERHSMSLGSGVLVGHTEHLGLVVTNWHVVQDAAGTIMVAFPDGFRCAARLLRTDRHWDLAALAIWRPNINPVPLAAYMPRVGDPLTIAGYGGGRYRAATGRLVDYAAPAANFPFELIEVSTPARQGDSGGPIFNTRGEVAGILFGTGGGQTMGSSSGRVRVFLLTVLDEFQRLEPEPVMVAQQSVPDPVPPVFETSQPELNRQPVRPPQQPRQEQLAQSLIPLPSRPKPPSPAPLVSQPRPPDIPAAPPAAAELAQIGPPQTPLIEPSQEPVLLGWSDLAGATRAEQVKTVLAGVGVFCMLLYALRLLGEMDGSRKPPPKRAARAKAA